jgi:Brp/Blh family beta-carotene 15,15'-monooxygenase
VTRRTAAFGAATLAASAAPLWGQLAFAALAIGAIGMVHGASDLALVKPDRRVSFLAAYGAVMVACLWWWLNDPALALPLFLLASAVHFALEDTGETTLERLALGGVLVTAPATFHPVGLAELLAAGGWDPARLPADVSIMRIVSAVCVGVVLQAALRRRDPRLAIGVAALLALPPLVGFSVGFLLLHALPQTGERRERLGCANDLAYLRSIAPVMLAASGVVAAVATVLLARDPTGVRALFAAIAALAMPHLLVTPWFDRAAAPLQRGASSRRPSATKA